MRNERSASPSVPPPPPPRIFGFALAVIEFISTAPLNSLSFLRRKPLRRKTRLFCGLAESSHLAGTGSRFSEFSRPGRADPQHHRPDSSATKRFSSDGYLDHPTPGPATRP